MIGKEMGNSSFLWKNIDI